MWRPTFAGNCAAIGLAPSATAISAIWPPSGAGTAVADFGWTTLSGGVAWIAWLFVHIWNLIGFRNRLVVLTQWAWSYFTYQRSVRLITDRHRDSDR